MAARIRVQHQDEVRARIQVGQLIKVLEKQALNDEAADLTPARLKAIEILLRKSLPDLSSIELKGDGGGPIRIVAQSTDETL
jgi:hypothetical protein